MKSERRHELEHNELADWLSTTFLAIKPYQNLIFGLLVLLLVGFLGYTLFHRQSASRAATAWNQLYKAIDSPNNLTDVITNYPKTPAAQLASMMTADISLRNGCMLLFQDKDLAGQFFAKAIQLYQSVLEQNRDSMVLEQATFGLARAYESNGQLTEAIKQYEEMVKKWPQGAYASEAAAALTRLNKQSSKAWYDRFAKFDPKPETEQTTSPDTKAKSSLETVPEEAPIYDGGKAFGSDMFGKGAKKSESTEAAEPSTEPAKPESTPSSTEPEKSNTLIPNPLPPMSLSSEPAELVVKAAEEHLRLDVFLARHFSAYSRGLLRRAIAADGVAVDGKRRKPAYRLLAGQRVTVMLPEIPRQTPQPENIPLDILYQDGALAVVNKPSGMVVHPARGHWSGTLAGALQFHFAERLSTLGGLTRPGIVHRLDRDTSGAILVACSDRAHAHLARQFHARTIEKEYFALVVGTPDRDADLIDCPIGVHPLHREKMAIRRDETHSRPAQSYYEVMERFDGYTAVKILPKTGRTHQIRVHLNHIGCPVLCDRQYGGRSRLTRGEVRGDPADTMVLLERQALHARRLRFVHPVSNQPLEIVAPLPRDLEAVLAELREYRKS